MNERHELNESLASELVRLLQELIAKHGDLPIENYESFEFSGIEVTKPEDWSHNKGEGLVFRIC